MSLTTPKGANVVTKLSLYVTITLHGNLVSHLRWSETGLDEKNVTK